MTTNHKNKNRRFFLMMEKTWTKIDRRSMDACHTEPTANWPTIGKSPRVNPPLTNLNQTEPIATRFWFWRHVKNRDKFLASSLKTRRRTNSNTRRRRSPPPSSPGSVLSTTRGQWPNNLSMRNMRKPPHAHPLPPPLQQALQHARSSPKTKHKTMLEDDNISHAITGTRVDPPCRLISGVASVRSLQHT